MVQHAITGQAICWDCGADVTASRPVVDTAPRCWRCSRRLADSVARPWAFTCPRCHALNHSPV